MSGSSSRPPHSPERVPSAGRGGVCREKEGGIEREREREGERSRGEFRATFLILHNTYDYDCLQSGCTVAKI